MLLMILKKIFLNNDQFCLWKIMGNLRKRINVRLVNNEKADQHILLIKFLVKIMPLFMKLNRF